MPITIGIAGRPGSVGGGGGSGGLAGAYSQWSKALADRAERDRAEREKASRGGGVRVRPSKNSGGADRDREIAELARWEQRQKELELAAAAQKEANYQREAQAYAAQVARASEALNRQQHEARMSALRNQSQLERERRHLESQIHGRDANAEAKGLTHGPGQKTKLDELRASLVAIRSNPNHTRQQRLQAEIDVLTKMSHFVPDTKIPTTRDQIEADPELRIKMMKMAKDLEEFRRSNGDSWQDAAEEIKQATGGFIDNTQKPPPAGWPEPGKLPTKPPTFEQVEKRAEKIRDNEKVIRDELKGNPETKNLPAAEIERLVNEATKGDWDALRRYREGKSTIPASPEERAAREAAAAAGPGVPDNVASARRYLLAVRQRIANGGTITPTHESDIAAAKRVIDGYERLKAPKGVTLEQAKKLPPGTPFYNDQNQFMRVPAAGGSAAKPDGVSAPKAAGGKLDPLTDRERRLKDLLLEGKAWKSEQTADNELSLEEYGLQNPSIAKGEALKRSHKAYRAARQEMFPPKPSAEAAPPGKGAAAPTLPGGTPQSSIGTQPTRTSQLMSGLNMRQAGGDVNVDTSVMNSLRDASIQQAAKNAANQTLANVEGTWSPNSPTLYNTVARAGAGKWTLQDAPSIVQGAIDIRDNQLFQARMNAAEGGMGAAGSAIAALNAFRAAAAQQSAQQAAVKNLAYVEDMWSPARGLDTQMITSHARSFGPSGPNVGVSTTTESPSFSQGVREMKQSQLANARLRAQLAGAQVTPPMPSFSGGGYGGGGGYRSPFMPQGGGSLPAPNYSGGYDYGYGFGGGGGFNNYPWSPPLGGGYESWHTGPGVSGSGPTSFEDSYVPGGGGYDDFYLAPQYQDPYYFNGDTGAYPPGDYPSGGGEGGGEGGGGGGEYVA